MDFSSGVMQLFFLVTGILGIGFLIGFHELGHFLFCKLFGIKTPSFSIGMGPRIFTKKIGETEFVLSAIPLGGYVEIAGAGEDSSGQTKEVSAGSFAKRPYWQKLFVMAGGIFFNLIFAYFALSFLYYVGIPRSSLLYSLHGSTVINQIEDDSPAQNANLMIGDAIVALNKKPVFFANDIIAFIKQHPHENINFTIMRDQQKLTIPVALGGQNNEPNTAGFLGVDFTIGTFSLKDSFINGFWATYSLTAQVLRAFKGLFTKQEFKNLGGPLVVIALTVKGAQHGFKIFLLLLTFISINLAVLNLIPLPILDGGQALYYTIEAISGRPLPERVREYIHYITWVLMLLLVLFLSIRDIWGWCW